MPTTNGVAYHIDLIKRGLEKLGHKVFILAPFFPGYKDTNTTVLRYPSLPNPLIKKYPVGIPLIPITKIKKLKVDIIHTHHPFMVGQFAAHVSKKLSTPLFFTAHTRYEQYLNYYMPHGYRLTSRLIKRDIKILAEKCVQVICPSKNTKNRLKKNGIMNTVVVHNGIEKNFFNKPKKKTTKQPAFIFTGRLEKEKNLQFLLKIAKELKICLPTFELVLVGSGSLFRKLQKSIYKLGLEENVILAGEVSRSLLPNIYKSFHLFITPSTSEVMPLSIIEASASGLPVVALKDANLEELVIHGKNGLLLKPEPKKIAKTIRDTVLDTNKLFTLSQNAFKHSKNFSCAKTVIELEKVYKAAI